MEEKKVKSHNLKYESEKKIFISGVKAVDSFSEKQILASLDNGKQLTINGEGLTITNLDTETGNVEIEGKAHQFAYMVKQTPKSILKKIFK